MPALDSSLISKAFGADADAGLAVPYGSHQDALRFLDAAIREANGIALLHGPAGSGKTMIVREQLDWSSRVAAVAYLDGEKLTPTRMIKGMLMQFGIQVNSTNDQFGLQQISNYLSRQTRRGKPPLLIIDNADRATPSALRQLNWLAALDERGKNSLHIILTGKERLTRLLRYDGMQDIARRHPATYSLNPMTKRETMIYLRTRLIAAGCDRAKRIFPVDVCDKLHEVSRGWPGLLNDRAAKVMKRMQELESATPRPRIVVTCDGRTVAKYELSVQQYVIGRAEVADIVIEDTYVSKVHLMLKVYTNAVVLLDLNSANGTTVNSTVVRNTILRNDDIIMLGRHRLKIENVPAISAEMNEMINETDTLTMQSVGDARRSRSGSPTATIKQGPWQART
jgi:type II secretory pathway predicted ATPase ExeA